jgi:hypothetical protein
MTRLYHGSANGDSIYFRRTARLYQVANQDWSTSYTYIYLYSRRSGLESG